jgi:hypothetical protein
MLTHAHASTDDDDTLLVACLDSMMCMNVHFPGMACMLACIRVLCTDA